MRVLADHHKTRVGEVIDMVDCCVGESSGVDDRNAGLTVRLVVLEEIHGYREVRCPREEFYHDSCISGTVANDHFDQARNFVDMVLSLVFIEKSMGDHSHAVAFGDFYTIPGIRRRSAKEIRWISCPALCE